MFDPWFMFNLWFQLFRAMLLAPLTVPLKVTEAWASQLQIARDLMRLSDGAGLRNQPGAGVGSRQPQLNQHDAEANQEDAEQAIQRFAQFVSSQSREVASASSGHSDRAQSNSAARRHRPRSGSRARAVAATSRSPKASVRSKSKQKKRRAARRR